MLAPLCFSKGQSEPCAIQKDIGTLTKWNDLEEKIEHRRIFLLKCFLPGKLLAAAIGGFAGGVLVWGVSNAVCDPDDHVGILHLIDLCLVALCSHFSYNLAHYYAKKIATYFTMVEFLRDCLHGYELIPSDKLSDFIYQFSLAYYKSSDDFSFEKAEEYFKAFDLFIKVSKLSLSNEEIACIISQLPEGQ